MFSFFGVAGKINKLGTTELLDEGDPAVIAADDTERDYLLAAQRLLGLSRPGHGRFLVLRRHSAAVRQRRRFLSAITRDYTLEADLGEGKAPASLRSLKHSWRCNLPESEPTPL